MVPAAPGSASTRPPPAGAPARHCERRVGDKAMVRCAPWLGNSRRGARRHGNAHVSIVTVSTVVARRDQSSHRRPDAPDYLKPLTISVCCPSRGPVGQDSTATPGRYPLAGANLCGAVRKTAQPRAFVPARGNDTSGRKARGGVSRSAQRWEAPGSGAAGDAGGVAVAGPMKAIWGGISHSSNALQVIMPNDSRCESPALI